MKRMISILLVVVLLTSLCACGQKKMTHNMDFGTKDKNIFSTFMENDNSQKVTLSENAEDEIKLLIDSMKIDFPYSDLYQTEECFNRLNVKFNVTTHKYSALNDAGKLDAQHLLNIVKNNNSNYLDEHTFGLEAPKDEFTLELCQLIIDTVNELQKRIPDIDYKRVYCNLGNLKILYKKGMVDNAQVTADMVMHISPNMFEIVELMSGDSACRDVVIHEIMHIIQIGCSCEEIENCTRRCGVSYRWSDFELNTSDFGWFFEGSAERSMCNLTGNEPITYKYMINYICSVNLATMLDEDVPANYAETISFYDDINKLYELFDCETKSDKYEILNMMIATNIIQMKPDEFMSVYASETGKDTAESAVVDELNYTLKPAICLVFAKHFYKNLAEELSDNDNVTLNDLCYLIAMFEASMDNHLKYTKEDLKTYNNYFVTEYKKLREKLFDGISSSCAVDVKTYYNSYSIFSDTDSKVVNASMIWNNSEKNRFYLERTDYLEFNINSKVN